MRRIRSSYCTLRDRRGGPKVSRRFSPARVASRRVGGGGGCVPCGPGSRASRRVASPPSDPGHLDANIITPSIFSHSPKKIDIVIFRNNASGFIQRTLTLPFFFGNIYKNKKSFFPHLPPPASLLLLPPPPPLETFFVTQQRNIIMTTTEPTNEKNKYIYNRSRPHHRRIRPVRDGHHGQQLRPVAADRTVGSRRNSPGRVRVRGRCRMDHGSHLHRELFRFFGPESVLPGRFRFRFVAYPPFRNDSLSIGRHIIMTRGD